MTKKYLLVVGGLVFALGMALETPAQRVVSSTPIGPIWQMQRPRLGIRAGEGVALGPNGRAVVFMGEPEPGPSYASLLVVELETGKKTVLRACDNFVMPSQPRFSPDGEQVVFVLHGPTWYYTSDIYVVDIDGQGLTKLTQSVAYIDKPGYPIGPKSNEYWVGAAYQRYYGSPRYSPDGSRILLQVHDVVGQIRDFTAVMNPDGSDLQILAEGRPCCWSADGKAVYYHHKGFLTRMDLETRTTRTVPLPSLQDRTPIGRMAGREWLAFRLNNGRIGWFNFGTATRAPEFIGEWSVPPVRMGGQEELALKGFDWSRSSEVLLWYQGEGTERFEVVRIFGPASLSR